MRDATIAEPEPAILPDDLFALVPGAEEAIAPATHIPLWTFGEQRDGLLYQAAMRATPSGNVVYFATRRDHTKIPAEYHSGTFFGSTWREVIEHAWEHRATLTVDRDPVWDVPWLAITTLRLHHDDRRNVSRPVLQQLCDEVTASLTGASAAVARLAAKSAMPPVLRDVTPQRTTPPGPRLAVQDPPGQGRCRCSHPIGAHRKLSRAGTAVRAECCRQDCRCRIYTEFDC